MSAPETDDGEPYYRTDGNMVCTCGKPYWRHPLDGPDGWQGKFLRRICNGDLVKL